MIQKKNGANALFSPSGDAAQGQSDVREESEETREIVTSSDEIDNFLSEKTITAKNIQATFVPPKKRKTLSTIIAGQAVTEENVSEKVALHVSQQNTKCSTNTTKKQAIVPTVTKGKGKKSSFVPPFKDAQVPGPSKEKPFSCDSDDEELNHEESDCCCVCKSFYPPRKTQLDHIFIVNWGQCDSCSHWTHLSFCSSVKVLRRHSVFLCPHCEVPSSEQ